jgi:hypothetical protein
MENTYFMQVIIEESEIGGVGSSKFQYGNFYTFFKSYFDNNI